MDAEWRAVKGYEGLYEVSSTGLVRSCDRVTYGRNRSHRTVRGRVLKPKINSASGYHQVSLSFEGRVEYRYVHRLVCEAFHGAPPSEMYEVCHGDGNRSNNTALNLRWGTRTENHADKRKHGTSGSPKKLTRKDAEEIRGLKGSGVRSVDVAKMFGVSPSNVDQIVSGRIWKIADKEQSEGRN